MSAREDMFGCELRNSSGYPSMASGRDLANTQASGASIVFSDNKQLLYTLMLSMMISGVSVGVALWARSDSAKAERETRMLEYYLLELDAKVIAAGISKSEDSISKKLEQERKR